MKKTRKIAGFCAAVLLVSGALSSCGGAKQTAGSPVTLNGDDIYPVQCEDTLTYWVGFDSRLEGSYANFGETPFAKELEKQTGIKIEYMHPQSGQENEQFNIMLAANELPDLVTYNWANYGGGPDTAIEEEYIYSLNEVLEKYAPALSGYLAEHPQVDKKIKTDIGNYYAFPFIRGEKWMTCSQGLVLRKDWLDKLGMKEPTTLDELEEVLRGFKTLGAKNPLVLTSGQLQMFFYAYGIAPDFYVDDGKVVYGYLTDEFEHVIRKIAQWYDEGLIDNNLVSVDNKYIQARMLNGDAGAFFGYVVSGIGALLDAKPNDEFDLIACRQPTVTGEKAEFSYIESEVLPNSSVAISTNCKNLELAGRFLDYGFTEAGHKLYNFGIEGVSYNMVDGKPVMTELITNNPDKLTFSQAAARYMRSTASGIFVHDPEYVHQSLTYPEQQQYAYDIWSDNDMEKHMMPPVTLLPEEQSEAADIMNNVSTYVAEKYISYITGKESLDTFGDMIQKIKDYNIDRVIEIRQNALDRYNKR